MSENIKTWPENWEASEEVSPEITQAKYIRADVVNQMIKDSYARAVCFLDSTPSFITIDIAKEREAKLIAAMDCQLIADDLYKTAGLEELK